MNFKSLSFFALVLAASLYVVRAEDQNGEANVQSGEQDNLADFDANNDEHDMGDHDLNDFDLDYENHSGEEEPQGN